MRFGLKPLTARRRQELRRLEKEGLALRTEEPDRALSCFKAVLARDANRVVSLRAAGRLLMKQRRYDDATPYWRRLGRLEKTDPEPRVQLARIHLQCGRDAEAAALTDLALHLAPQHAAALDLRLQIAETSLSPPDVAEKRSPVLDLTRRVIAGLMDGRVPGGQSLTSRPTGRRPAVEILVLRAERLAEAGDGTGLAETVERLFGIEGPSTRVLELIRRHEAALKAASPAWLDPVLANAAGEDARQARDRTLTLRARRQAAEADAAGFSATLCDLLKLSGPTSAVTDLATDYAELVRRSGERRLLALLEFERGSTASRERSLLTKARARARQGDAAGFAEAVSALLELIGPTTSLTALAVMNSALITRTGEKRLIALLEVGDGPSAVEKQKLFARAQLAARGGDAVGFRSTLNEIFDLTGPGAALAEMVRGNAALIENGGDLRLLALLEFTRGRQGRRASDPEVNPRVDALLQSLSAAHGDADINAVSRLLNQLLKFDQTDNRVRNTLAEQASSVLTLLERRRTSLPARTLTIIERRLTRVYSTDAWLVQALARQNEIAGSARAGLRLYENLADSAVGAATALLHAATLACDLGGWDTAGGYARRAVSVASNDRRLLGNLTSLLAHHGRHDDVIACWRLADAQGPRRMWVKQGLARALAAAGDGEGLLKEVSSILSGGPELGTLSVIDQNHLLDIVRRLVQVLRRARSAAGVDDLAASLHEREPPSALRDWILASLDLVRPDYKAALRRLDGGLTGAPTPEGVLLDLHAEKALVYQMYHLYGEALAEMNLARAAALDKSSHYRRRLEQLQEVADICGAASGQLPYPECLFDVLLAEVARAPIQYAPRSRHIAMVSGSLGQGGGERQTITVVRRMLKDARIEKLSLFVRSTHLRESDDFFLPSIAKLPVDLSVYGADWSTPTDTSAALPELAHRSRILAVLDLMPHNAREEIVRLSRRLLDRRPAAVHIWQDIPYAALACALVGVPRFFIHRGSLSPLYWEQTEHQTAVHFRPMRHVYRRLLERPDFVLLNNSVAGCETDRAWLGWPDPTPFQVVYNAVDFSQLGPDRGRNLSLRRQLGIPDNAPVIGGSFRVVAVKRPRFWIEAARRIRDAVPDAHFLIIGDGDMTDEVANFAAAHGFADAVHLPGRVSNVGDWYRAMDVALMTSEREGIPNAIIEGQHFGVPIVATDVGGIPEAMEVGRTGYVAPRDDGPGPYADLVIGILKDRAWFEAARARSPAFVHEKFSLDRILDSLVAYYGIAEDVRTPFEARA